MKDTNFSPRTSLSAHLEEAPAAGAPPKALVPPAAFELLPCNQPGHNAPASGAPGPTGPEAVIEPAHGAGLPRAPSIALENTAPCQTSTPARNDCTTPPARAKQKTQATKEKPSTQDGRESLTAWLMSEQPRSRRQAALGRAYQGWRTFARNRLAMTGLFIVLALVVIALFADLLVPYSAYTGDLRTTRLLPPSWSHWLGTDDQGRDILSRLMVGSRITLFVVLLVAVLAAPIGLVVGTVAGYAGGLVDAALMRITDIFLAFPRLILALAFVAALGPGIENAVIAIAITSWPPYARMARAETLTIRQSDYIAAVQLLGASPWRIVLRHIMPLCLPSVIVRVTLDMAGIILTAAGLGFLGLGAQPPMPEWGAMIANGRLYVLDQWWVAAAPGAAIFIVSLAFNLLGDGLRDALDPKAAK